MAYLHDGRRFWQVYAHRGDKRIVVRAYSQTEAWFEAVKSACSAHPASR